MLGILFASATPAQEPLQDCADCPRMVSIPAGTFTMGSPPSEAEWEYAARAGTSSRFIWGEELPTSGAPRVEDSCKYHRSRGGSWDDFPEELRSARCSRPEPNRCRNDAGFPRRSRCDP